MAFAGKTERKENVTAAIAANIWMSNERGARNAFPDEPLDFIVLDCLVCALGEKPPHKHFVECVIMCDRNVRIYQPLNKRESIVTIHLCSCVYSLLCGTITHLPSHSGRKGSHKECG